MDLCAVKLARRGRLDLKFVDLTQAQYDALDPPDSDTLYFITDAGS